MIPALWIAAAVLPLLTAAGLTVMHRSAAGPGGRAAQLTSRLSALSTLPAAALAVLGPPEPMHVPWLLLGTTVSLDVVSRALLLVTAVLYAAACLAASRDDERSPGLIAFLLVCFIGNAGVLVAADAMTFYATFSLMSLAAAGLVLHERTDQTRRAARVYLILAVASEMLVLAALVMTAQAGGYVLADAPAAVAASERTGLICVLAILGFGIKAGLIGLHVWLPLAHPAAPPPASAVLSGAMVKAGLVGMIRILPLGQAELPSIGLALAALALLGALLAVPLGLAQRDPKAVLAYSTVSQMGFLLVLIGAGLAEPAIAPACITAAVIYAVHHGLAKGALFLGVPVAKHHGVGSPLVIAGLLIAGAVVAGAPLSSGSIGKYAAKNAVDGLEVAGIDVYSALPWVATGTTVLLLRMAWALRRQQSEPATRAPSRDPELIAWLALCLLSAVLPWVLTGAWVPLRDVPGLDPVTLWDAAWPVLIGLALGAAARIAVPRLAPGLPRRLEAAVPAGDAIVPLERTAAAAGSVLRRGAALLGTAAAAARSGAQRGFEAAVRTDDALDRADDRLGRWRALGAAVLVVLLLLIAVAVTGGGR